MQENQAIRDYGTFDRLRDYVFSKKAVWYWIVITAAMTSTMIVLIVPENAYPAAYVRYLFGTFFVLYLPGYAFIKTLFPGNAFDNLERTVLSVLTSLVLVTFTGLFMNYSPWGITLVPITLSLLALTAILATAAVIREHEALHK